MPTSPDPPRGVNSSTPLRRVTGVLASVTATDFDEQWAETAVAQLRDRGVEIASGMTDSDVAAVESSFGCPMPPDLSMFLRAGVPVSPKWARWADGGDVVAADSQDWLRRAFAFDIEHAGYWHPRLGEQPEDLTEAIKQAIAVVATARTLFPIYSHRFLVSQPLEGPRAMLSVWQSVDTIFYGNDLADYLASVGRKPVRADPHPRRQGNHRLRGDPSTAMATGMDDHDQALIRSRRPCRADRERLRGGIRCHGVTCRSR